MLLHVFSDQIRLEKQNLIDIGISLHSTAEEKVDEKPKESLFGPSIYGLCHRIQLELIEKEPPKTKSKFLAYLLTILSTALNLIFSYFSLSQRTTYISTHRKLKNINFSARLLQTRLVC